jgi:hypothetical protein
MHLRKDRSIVPDVMSGMLSIIDIDILRGRQPEIGTRTGTFDRSMQQPSTIEL